MSRGDEGTYRITGEDNVARLIAHQQGLRHVRRSGKAGRCSRYPRAGWSPKLRYWCGPLRRQARGPLARGTRTRAYRKSGYRLRVCYQINRKTAWSHRAKWRRDAPVAFELYEGRPGRRGAGGGGAVEEPDGEGREQTERGEGDNPPACGLVQHSTHGFVFTVCRISPVAVRAGLYSNTLVSSHAATNSSAYKKVAEPMYYNIFVSSRAATNFYGRQLHLVKVGEAGAVHGENRGDRDTAHGG